MRANLANERIRANAVPRVLPGRTTDAQFKQKLRRLVRALQRTSPATWTFDELCCELGQIA